MKAFIHENRDLAVFFVVLAAYIVACVLTT
jgi:hypothetical protein